MSNSDRCRWKLIEQTMIRVRIKLVLHTQCSTMTSITQRQEGLISPKPGHRIHYGAREVEDDIQEQTPTPERNTQRLEEQMHSSNEAT